MDNNCQIFERPTLPKIQFLGKVGYLEYYIISKNLTHATSFW